MAVRFLIIGFLIVCTGGQELTAQSIYIQESPAVASMLDHYKNYYGRYPELKAHRIQVTSTTDRRQMDVALRKLDRSYPDLFVDWKHTAPYYRVIVGAYLTRWEAETALYAFRKDFPGSVIIYDNIPKDQFLKSP